VVNAEKVHVTGRKRTDKMYRWHSGYIGGLREVSFEKMIKSHPDRVIEWAVQGMLPKNRLGARWQRSSRSTGARPIRTRRSSLRRCRRPRREGR